MTVVAVFNKAVVSVPVDEELSTTPNEILKRKRRFFMAVDPIIQPIVRAVSLNKKLGLAIRN